MQVILRPLAVMDLSVSFARPLEGNKIRHYKVGMSEQMGRGITPLEIVKQHILSKEPDAEIVVEEYKHLQNPNTMSGMEITKAPGVLDTRKDIEAALLQKEIRSTLHQYNELTFSPNRFQKFLGYFTRAINRLIIFPINNVLYRLQNAFKPNPFESVILAELTFEEIQEKKSIYRRIQDSIRLITPLNPMEDTYVRMVTPCLFLTAAYEEGQEERAFHYIRDDLAKLHAAGALMGHLAMPSICLLADEVGDGKQKAAVFAFVFADFKKLAAYTGTPYNSILSGKDALAAMHLTTSSREGEIKKLPGLERSVVEIEIERISTVADQDHSDYLAALAPLYLKAAEEYEEKEKLAKALAAGKAE